MAHRLPRVAALSLALVVLLTACTGKSPGDESHKQPEVLDDSTPTADPSAATPEPVQQLRGVEFVRAPSYPKRSNLPPTLTVRGQTVTAGLPCAVSEQRTFFTDYRGQPSLRGVARDWLDFVPEQRTIVVVRQSPKSAVMLLIGKDLQSLRQNYFIRSDEPLWYLERVAGAEATVVARNRTGLPTSNVAKRTPVLEP